MPAQIQELESNNFNDSIKQGAVLVDFWAPWCGPCKAITPILEEVAGELSSIVRVAKLNVDNAREVAVQYGIRNIPTLLLFKDGVVVEKIVGLVGKDDLVRAIRAKA